MRILVVEDDASLADVLARGLKEEGYAVDLCADGDDAVLQASLMPYDGVVLDVMLPGKDGFEVCRELRRQGVQTPILMLTARDTLDDTVTGLEAGADDYLTKPFAFRELRARLQSIIRRSSGTASSELRAGDLVLDIASREVRVADRPVALTNKEYQVLEYLMHNQGRVVTRTMIEDHVWGYEYAGISNAVDVYVKRLRHKLGSTGDSAVIETFRGAGYKLRQGEA